jgi:hypothetical protein
MLATLERSSHIKYLQWKQQQQALKCERLGSSLHAQHSTSNAVFEWAGVSQRLTEIYEDKTGGLWQALLLGRKECVSHVQT